MIMSSEKRWLVNDAFAVLLQISRLCCLAPVRFVEISTDTFVYISRPLVLLSVIITSIVQLCIFNFVYLVICSTKRESYKTTFLILFNECVVVVFVSYAVLHIETRIKNYMTCLMKLKRALIGLQSTEEYNIKKWHVLIMFITLTSGITFLQIMTVFAFNGPLNPLTCIMTLELTMAVVVQQQFLYFSLYVSFVLKIIKQQLQEELFKIKRDKDGGQPDNSTTVRLNIPLKSINKAIDMIGMTDKLFPDDITTRKQKIAQKIHQIKHCYVLICEVILELGNSDNLLLFLQLISFSFNLVDSLYNFIIFIQEDDSLKAAKLFVLCFEIFVVTMRLIMIVEPCHVAHEMILKIRFLLCEIMCHVTSKNDPIFRVMEGFYHQLVLNDISYTALGICKIGRSLVTSILGVATTVLIAIFQF